MPHTPRPTAPSATIARLFETRRFCYHIPADGYIEGQGYRVSVVFEGEPGHYPTGDWPYEGQPGQKIPWFWGTDYDAACRAAEEANEKIGISKRLAAEIVASSMGVSKERQRHS